MLPRYAPLYDSTTGNMRLVPIRRYQHYISVTGAENRSNITNPRTLRIPNLRDVQRRSRHIALRLRNYRLALSVLPTTPYVESTRPNVVWTPEPRLSYEQRDAIRWIRSRAVRESIPDERMAILEKVADDPAVWAERLNAFATRGYRGIVDATETRVSERGASGIAGIRGTATRVTLRDAVDRGELQDSFLMRGIATVGCATHPLATDAMYDAAIRECRKHSGRCAVRVITASGSVVRPVSEYVKTRNDRRKARRQAFVARYAETRAMRDTALMAGMGAMVGLADNTA